MHNFSNIGYNPVYCLVDIITQTKGPVITDVIMTSNKRTKKPIADSNAKGFNAKKVIISVITAAPMLPVATVPNNRGLVTLVFLNLM